MKYWKRLFFSMFGFVLFSCSGNDIEVTSDEEYLNEVNTWHHRRIENLKKETGWLNLAGLYWLKEGENSFGSDEGNDIVLPENKADKFLGKIILRDSVITAEINPGPAVFYNGQEIKKIVMISDNRGNPTILSHNTLRWFVIKRGERFGIRLRDLEAELLTSFNGIERFPVQDKWRIEADFIRHDPPKKIFIPSIQGTVTEDISPGRLVFSIENNQYSLEPTLSGKNRLFIVFADLTSGDETYGAGRFLYTDGPDSNNIVVLDFNKAYNPPCAFTKYATCPLPPEENKLRLRITAGEKNFGEVH